MELISQLFLMQQLSKPSYSSLFFFNTVLHLLTQYNKSHQATTYPPNFLINNYHWTGYQRPISLPVFED